MRNAIPRESVAEFVIPEKEEKALDWFIKTMEAELKAEHNTTDPNLTITIENGDTFFRVLQKGFQSKLLKSLYACANGIYRMSPDILHLVQTSNNLARVLVKEGEYSIQCLTRSSVDSEKMDLANALKSTFDLIGAKVDFKGSYPGWAPKPEAAIVKIMGNLYKELYKEDALIGACHAGLECGILGGNYPDIEMISFGPNIRGAHSPDEKVQISSVQKYWAFFMETLQRIPEK